jgi:hypothetical protein
LFDKLSDYQLFKEYPALWSVSKYVVVPIKYIDLNIRIPFPVEA